MDSNNKKLIRNLIIYLGIPILIIIIIASIYGSRQSINYRYSDIINHFKEQEVKEFSMNLGSGAMQIALNNNNVLSYTAPDVSLVYRDIEPYITAYNEAHPNSPMKYDLIRPAETSWILNLLPTLLLVGIAIFFWIFMLRRMGQGGVGGQMNFGKARFKQVSDEKRKTTFADVAGADEEKEELQEIVEFLKDPAKFDSLGARIPKGVLLVGPPGTGKTLLARAVAGEAGVQFFSISGSDFVEMFVGVGASRVRDLFDQAKKNNPCIIFIDEIDAVGRQRGAGFGGGHDEREQTLNQLLVEMDGFGANDGVIMIAATNRPDILDPALMRPGRFDRQVVVSYPDIKGREAILNVHAKGKPLAQDVDLKTIAGGTAGFTGADLENLLNEAALLAARANKNAIGMTEIEDATIKVVVGSEKKSRVMSDKEKRITAYHETGHAITTYFCKSCDPVHQISIIPRGRAGGYTMSIPTEDKSYKSKIEMLEGLIVMLGGRAAEAVIIGDITTGASNDIERATKTVRQMVTKYGMSETLGPIMYGSSNDEPFLGRDMGHVKDYSERTANEIDDEVRSIMTNAYKEAERILRENIDKLHEIAKYLLENEKMDGETFKQFMEGTYNMKELDSPSDDDNSEDKDFSYVETSYQEYDDSDDNTLQDDSPLNPAPSV